ncbi:signal transduction histidine kinase [Burkholderiales bacterium JOSHI_001]|nr:signal transduction histidine kinase [Burkholderiales bacterium JOSHI_001]
MSAVIHPSSEALQADPAPEAPPWWAVWPLSRVAVVLAALVLVALWAAVGWVLADQREEVMRAETRRNTNLAQVLQEQTERVIATVDQAMLRLAAAAASGPVADMDLVRIAGETGLAPRILVQLSLVDKDGLFQGSNIDPGAHKAGAVDLSQREHVKVHLSPTQAADAARRLPADGLFIGRPVLGKVSKRWTLQFSRRITGADGRTQGVVVASLDPGYFEEVYSRVALGGDGGVTLVGEDMEVRARVMGGRATGMGTALSASSPFAAGPRAAQGEYEAPSSIDGVQRRFAYRKIGHYPLYVTVATGAQEALTGWRANRATLLALAALSSLVVVGGTAGFVTGLRRLERSNQALQQSEASARAANQAKTEFLAAMSHELRTPLTSIRGFAELLEHRLPQPNFKEQARLIRKGAEHLGTLLTEILDLSKMEAGAMPLEHAEVDLHQLLRGTVDYYALSAAEKGLALHLNLDDEVPAQMSCDGLRVKQILSNLLSNAVKFTDAGRVSVDVECLGGELLCHVTDTGPGIAPDLHDKVFERFSQGHARVSYQHGGTGLGLALARALAQRMGGRLTLRSQAGAGSCFTLALPLAAAPVAA